MDRVSALSDDLLVKIISLLTLKQALSTSLLSSRWRDLWKFYSEFFDFDGPIYELNSYHKVYVAHSIKNPDFINMVNQVMQYSKAITIKRMRVIFEPCCVPHQVIDNWIRLAALKNVQCLELELPTQWSGCPDLFSRSRSETYVFPSYSYCRFRFLRMLSLKFVKIYVQDIESLLVDCPNLEFEALNFVVFRFFGNSYKPMDINISAPNLLSFHYAPRHAKTKLVLEGVIKLNYLSLWHHWCRFRNHLPHVMELVWDMNNYVYCDCLMQSERGSLGQLFPNLKKFTIKGFYIDRYRFSILVDWLQTVPLLENLTLEFLSEVKMSDYTWNNMEDHRYDNLETVKFIGSAGTKNVEIFRYFISHAPLLDKIIVDPCEAHCLGKPAEISYRESRRYLEDRDCAINLTASLPFKVDIV
ncbi:hypothetical protein ACFE04_031282 [Oxalis oulophora]